MEDRLIDLLKCFHLHARVFQAGPFCDTSEFYEGDKLGYIHLVKEGTIRLESPHHPTQLIDEPSVFFYMNPTRHRLVPVGGKVETVCASLEFGAGLGNPLTQALPDLMVIRLRDMPNLDQALQLLFLEAAQQHCGRQAVLDRLMEVVFIQILRDAMEQQRLQVGLLAGLADTRLAKAFNAMHRAPARPWTLEQLAQQSGMSRARFASHFHDVVGITPGNYLTQWRMANAQSLLRQGKPVQWVSDTVGYGSASALSRAFRAQLGLSPTEWLNKFK